MPSETEEAEDQEVYLKAMKGMMDEDLFFSELDRTCKIPPIGRILFGKPSRSTSGLPSILETGLVKRCSSYCRSLETYP